jgi:hypothetical protein
MMHDVARFCASGERSGACDPTGWIDVGQLAAPRIRVIRVLSTGFIDRRGAHVGAAGVVAAVKQPPPPACRQQHQAESECLATPTAVSSQIEKQAIQD